MITAKHIQRSNIVVTYPEGILAIPEPAQLFGLYSVTDAKGSVFSDTPSMATRIFEFPVLGLQWIFEPTKIRLEDKNHRAPADSKLAHEMHRVLRALYGDKNPHAYGFNYDIVYRTHNVIPTQAIMASFVQASSIEEIKDFGWQYTLAKEKGKRTETYFFKAVSPIEYSVHANFHFNEPILLPANEMQKSFERRYEDVDESIEHIAF